jgi:hypothetical protein
MVEYIDEIVGGFALGCFFGYVVIGAMFGL